MGTKARCPGWEQLCSHGATGFGGPFTLGGVTWDWASSGLLGSTSLNPCGLSVRSVSVPFVGYNSFMSGAVPY